MSTTQEVHIVVVGRSIAGLTTAVAAAEVNPNVRVTLLQSSLPPAVLESLPIVSPAFPAAASLASLDQSPSPAHGDPAPPPPLNRMHSNLDLDELQSIEMTSKFSFVRTGLVDSSVLEVVATHSESVIQWLTAAAAESKTELSIEFLLECLNGKLKKHAEQIRVVEFSKMLSLERDLLTEKYYGDLLGDTPGENKDEVHPTQRVVCVTGVQFEDENGKSVNLKADAVILTPATTSEVELVRDLISANASSDALKELNVVKFGGFSKKEALQLTVKCGGTVILPSSPVNRVALIHPANATPKAAKIFIPTRLVEKNLLSFVTAQESNLIEFKQLTEDST
jgi:hypothetical protein